MQSIQEYLELTPGKVYKLSDLAKYTSIHTIYNLDLIACFYRQYAFYEVDFIGQKTTITEILIHCKDLIAFMDQDLYLDLLNNIFIIKNGLLNDLESIGSNASDFLKYNPDLIHREYEFLIESNDRIKKLVLESKLQPFMVDCNGINLQFNKNTFKYLLSRKKISIPALMAYDDLDMSEIKLVGIRIANDIEFSNDCKRFIEDQGILNTTMYIISSLCGLNKHSMKFDTDIVHTLYCPLHSQCMYLSFNTFKSVGNLSRHQVYLMYLIHKKTLKDDVDDMILAIKSPEDSLHECLNTASISESVDLTLTPIDINYIHIKKEKSINAEILNMLLKTSIDIVFDSEVFKYLPELAEEDYFEKICKKYANKILEYNIFEQLPKCITEVKSVVNFIDQHRKRKLKKDENNLSCSLETIKSSILFSSCDDSCNTTENNDVILNDLNLDGYYCDPPCFINFQDYPWLEEDDKIILLEDYIHRYSIDECVDNMILIKNMTSSLNDYFKENIDGITSLFKKVIVCCKLNILCKDANFNDTELNRIVEKLENPFILREDLYSAKTRKSTIKTFLSKLTHSEIDQIICDLETKKASTIFITAFIEFVENRYEFSHIHKLLSSFMSYGDLEITKFVQKYLIKLLNSRFVDESYVPYIVDLYSKMLGFADPQIRKNNDKIILSVGKVAKMMEKSAFIGNIKKAKTE